MLIDPTPQPRVLLPFFAAPNLVTAKIVESYPWDCLVPEQENWLKKIEKTERRQALFDPDTVWNVYSAIRGAAGHLVISNTNPPAAARGLVVEYDMKADIDQVCGYFDQIPEMLIPNYFEISLGGRLRTVWCFEKEILTHSSEFCVAVLQAFCSEIGAKTLLPGFDETSLRPNERWVNGGVWYGVNPNPLPWDYCFGVLCGVAKQGKYFGKQKIPLEEIETEIKRRYPGRWQGDFVLDATGVRFWDERADNPTECQVKPDGMLCFTGNDPFVTWEQLISKDWVEQKSVLARAKNTCQGFCFDGTHFWEQFNDRWFIIKRCDLRIRLGGRGVSSRKEKGQTLSDFESCVLHIKTVNRVDKVVYSTDFPPGLRDLQGHRILNIVKPKIYI